MISQFLLDNDWSFDKYGIYISSHISVEIPEVNQYVIEVPNRNGALDLTDAIYGYPTYKNRKIEFDIVVPSYNSANLASFINDHHGRYRKIAFSDGLSFYYKGRIFIKEVTESLYKQFLQAKVEIEAEPFKYSTKPKGFNLATLTASQKIEVENLGYPTFAIWDGVGVEFLLNDKTYQISNKMELKKAILQHGKNTIQIIRGNSLSCEFYERFI